MVPSPRQQAAGRGYRVRSFNRVWHARMTASRKGRARSNERVIVSRPSTRVAWPPRTPPASIMPWERASAMSASRERVSRDACSSAERGVSSGGGMVAQVATRYACGGLVWKAASLHSQTDSCRQCNARRPIQTTWIGPVTTRLLHLLGTASRCTFSDRIARGASSARASSMAVHSGSKLARVIEDGSLLLHSPGMPGG
jgi:hypothetical protein